MSQIGLKLVKHATIRKHHNETNWSDNKEPNKRKMISATSFSIKRNPRIANSFLVEHHQMCETKYDNLLKTINRLLKITGVSWLICFFSLIAFSAISYTTPKQTTGYHCLECPSGLNYNTVTGTCVNLINCTSSQYWNGSMCVLTYNNGTCTNSNQCLSPMICNFNSNGSICNCPYSYTLNKCDCPTRVSGNEFFFLNGTTCIPALSYGTPCYGNYSCQYLTQKTYCNQTCQCAALQYFNTIQSICMNQLIINQSCILTTDCRTDLSLSCKSGLCQCNSTNFWDGTACVPPYTYNNQTCTSSNQCTSPLVCNLIGTSCNCPAVVPINKCDCPRSIGNENYWNGVTCAPAISFDNICFGTYTCQTMTQNTYCNQTCQCGSNTKWNSSSCGKNP